jgi:hypothetical protein
MRSILGAAREKMDDERSRIDVERATDLLKNERCILAV